LPDGGCKRRVLALGKAGVERPLDVADVAALAEILVDEGVDVAKLQLDRRLDVVEADDPRKVGDDAQPAFKSALVVVCQFEDEQVFKDLASCAFCE
jgi:hypothetical protein